MASLFHFQAVFTMFSMPPADMATGQTQARLVRIPDLSCQVSFSANAL
jgi:hypothetical protein